jgi:predicted DNA repair protein MutK
MSVGFFAVFDDIAVLMEKTAVMGKVTLQKTTGVLGDDLAVNAEKASGFAASRELPVLWAITLGSFRNKLIILPLAFLLSAFASWLIIPILMLGGLYLAYEGAEKIYDYFFHKKEALKAETLDPDAADFETYEAGKIKSAVTTDFILSIEIVIIALGTVVGQPILMQIVIVSAVAFLATAGVYGLVALLVRMDDIGLKFIEMESRIMQKAGGVLVAALPKVIKALSVIGTLAMLLVAGGIYVHNITELHHLFSALPPLLGDLLAGLAVGVLVLTAVKAIAFAGALFHSSKEQ